MVGDDVSRYGCQWITTPVTPSNSLFNPSKPSSTIAKELQNHFPKFSLKLECPKKFFKSLIYRLQSPTVIQAGTWVCTLPV